jgi:sugar-specific transcriptional regulator TrmB
MTETPSVFFMFVIGGLSALFGGILFYTAMLLKELGQAVVDSREIIKNSNKIIEESIEIVADSKDIVKMVKGTVTELNDNIIEPIKKVGSVISMITGFVDGFTGKEK